MKRPLGISFSFFVSSSLPLVRSWKQRSLVTGRPCNTFTPASIALVSTVSRGWPLPPKPTLLHSLRLVLLPIEECRSFYSHPSPAGRSPTLLKHCPSPPPQDRILSQKRSLQHSSARCRRPCRRDEHVLAEQHERDGASAEARDLHAFRFSTAEPTSRCASRITTSR